MTDEREFQVGTLAVRSLREGDERYIKLTGELDIESAGALDAELRRVETTGVARILVDLGGLQFADSTAIRLMLGVCRRSRRSGEWLALLRGMR